MRRRRMVVRYDGTDYCGFQRQPDRPTVQGALETALSQICGHPVEVVGAGRTDAGVHALGQVAHFDTTGSVPTERFERVLNHWLGPAIVVGDVQETGEEFHARFSARRRTYHYYVRRERPSPFQGRYLLYEPGLRPDAATRMREALRALEGTHDFAPLSTGGAAPAASTRTVFRTALEERGSLLRMELEANAFLRSMVRVIVGVALEIGRGRRDPEALGEVLRTGKALAEIQPASPRGLFLVRVEYPDGYSSGAGDPSAELVRLVEDVGR